MFVINSKYLITRTAVHTNMEPSCGQSSKRFVITIYDSRVTLTRKLPRVPTILEQLIFIVERL